jgi:hypothetical protein
LPKFSKYKAFVSIFRYIFVDYLCKYQVGKWFFYPALYDALSQITREYV